MADLHVSNDLLATWLERISLHELVVHLDNAFVDASFTGCQVLAPEAQSAEALLASTLIKRNVQLVEHVVDKLAVLGLSVELHPGAVVKHLRHGHAVEGCVLLQSCMTVVGHGNDGPLSHEHLQKLRYDFAPG